MVSLELEIMLQERDASGPKSNCDCKGVRDKQCIIFWVFFPNYNTLNHKVSDNPRPLAAQTCLENPFTTRLHHASAPFSPCMNPNPKNNHNSNVTIEYLLYHLAKRHVQKPLTPYQKQPG